MIVANVGDDRRIRCAHREATTQQTAARNLQYSEFAIGMAQHTPAAARAGVIVAVEHLVADLDRVGTTMPGDKSSRLGHACKQTCRRGLAVGAGDQRHGQSMAFARPIDAGRVRHFGERVDAGVFALTDAEIAIADQKLRTRLQRRCVKGAQGGHRRCIGAALHPRHDARAPRRDVFGDAVQRQLPCPFRHMRGNHQLIERRRQRQMQGGLKPAAGYLDIVPTQCPADVARLAAPACTQVNRNGRWRTRFQHRTRCVEQNRPPRQTPRVDQIWRAHTKVLDGRRSGR